MAAVFPPVSGGSSSQASVSAIIISLNATQASVSTLQMDIGDPSASGTSLYATTKYLYQSAIGASFASVVGSSIISHILAKGALSGNYDNATDSLEAISDKIGTPAIDSTNLYNSLKYLYQKADATLASAIDDSLIGHILAVDGDVSDYNDNLHSLEALYNAFTGQVNAVDRVAGKYQVFEKSVISAANAGTVTVATITTMPCLIESVVIHADTAQTPALTSAAVQGGAGGVVTFIDATDAAVANIAVIDEQVGWTGAVRLAATKTVIMDLVGTGATAVDLTVTVGYRACSNGGYLV